MREATMRKLLTACSLLLLVATTAAQQVEPPAAPASEAHSLWSRQALLALGVSTAARAADATLTCNALSNGGRENWLPTQSCGGVVGFIAAGEAVQIGATWALHRTHHHKLELIVPWVGVGISIAAIAASEARPAPRRP